MSLTHIKILMIFLFKMTRMHYTQSAQISCFENDATITYRNRHKFLVLKMTPLSHTKIGANFLFWKWRHYCISKLAQNSCFENDATTIYHTYLNRREFPILKIMPLSQDKLAQISCFENDATISYSYMNPRKGKFFCVIFQFWISHQNMH